MTSERRIQEELRELASQTSEFVAANSAGEMSRHRNWRFFAEAIPRDHNLRELAEECLNALPDGERELFLGRINR